MRPEVLETQAQSSGAERKLRKCQGQTSCLLWLAFTQTPQRRQSKIALAATEWSCKAQRLFCYLASSTLASGPPWRRLSDLDMYAKLSHVCPDTRSGPSSCCAPQTSSSFPPADHRGRDACCGVVSSGTVWISCPVLQQRVHTSRCSNNDSSAKHSERMQDPRMQACASTGSYSGAPFATSTLAV